MGILVVGCAYSFGELGTQNIPYFVNITFVQLQVLNCGVIGEGLMVTSIEDVQENLDAAEEDLDPDLEIIRDKQELKSRSDRISEKYKEK